jgi:hypothetical protein
MGTGFRVQPPEEWADRLEAYRRDPWFLSAVTGAIVGLAVGSATSWFRGVIAGILLFLVVRFVLGPYWLRLSRHSPTDSD